MTQGSIFFGGRGKTQQFPKTPSFGNKGQSMQRGNLIGEKTCKMSRIYTPGMTRISFDKSQTSQSPSNHNKVYHQVNLHNISLRCTLYDVRTRIVVSGTWQSSTAEVEPFMYCVSKSNSTPCVYFSGWVLDVGVLWLHKFTLSLGGKEVRMFWHNEKSDNGWVWVGDGTMGKFVLHQQGDFRGINVWCDQGRWVGTRLFILILRYSK